jgi:hypothetical protein
MFWVARPNAYEIELWDNAGNLRLTIQRDPAWFTEWDSFEPGGPQRSRPHSQIVDIGEDANGRLWVLSYVADAEWKPATQSGREARISPRSQSNIFDSVIDVLDAGTGDVLASTTLDAAAAGFAGPGVLYIHDEDDDGLVQIRVLNLYLDSNGR